ncbi:MAG: hypothetical protein O4861_19610, partial [Trichodesmium sp. St16_bin4-tuft]|nr:hypothetical protein [Trichodesmium sp. St16_bin4-tuft]
KEQFVRMTERKVRPRIEKRDFISFGGWELELVGFFLTLPTILYYLIIWPPKKKDLIFSYFTYLT